MRTELFIIVTFVGLAWIAWRTRLKPLRKHGEIDAIVPAFNEEVCIVDAVKRLLRNRILIG